ncbi:MAG: DNA-binding response regulator [Desulfobulbaceae bacterium]|nr:MAG: DNA-binding response regulator [Desulfobulbaceae bacterium]
MDVKTLKVLVIEDNQDLAANITDYLSEKEYSVDYAMDGVTGLHLALNVSFDVIILDIMLPKIDGISLCQRYRQEAEEQAPILMLTARDTIDDKLSGFAAGADDYLVKPFSLRELEARIKALKRRHEPSVAMLQVGDISVDTGTRKVRVSNREVYLNKTCFSMLVMLMQAAPNYVSRQEFEDKLWGDFPPGSDVLRSHIYSLRKALDEKGEASCIETARGIGFRITNKHVDY